MKKTIKRTLSLVLSVLLLCGVMPAATAAGTAYKVGDIVEFGSYPQTLVDSSELIAALDAQGGTWHSYNYYTGVDNTSDGRMSPSDYMQYCDVTYGGQKYRGVIFTKYRPYFTGYVSADNTSNQDDNHYSPKKTYWFRYAPLQWRVLDPDTGLVLCSSIIDSQPYNNYILSANDQSWGNAGKTYYANNYAECSLRQWLNNDFYNTAFTTAQQSKIVATTLDNSAFNPEYDSVPTTDKVFLLSFDDAVNTDYGFDGRFVDDPVRQIQGSDYAKCQGLDVNSNSYSYWWLRTGDGESRYACGIVFRGFVRTDFFVGLTNMGICPALRLNFNPAAPETFTVAVNASEGGTASGGGTFESGKSATVTAAPNSGYTFDGWYEGASKVSGSASYTFTVTKNITLTANFTKEAGQSTKIAIRNFKANITVDYRSTITFAADVTGPVDGAKTHWFVDGKDTAAGDTFTVKEVKKDFNIQAKYIKDGSVLAESDTETVKVNSGFFARLKAFFRALFGKLPVVVQDYFGVAIAG